MSGCSSMFNGIVLLGCDSVVVLMCVSVLVWKCLSVVCSVFCSWCLLSGYDV